MAGKARRLTRRGQAFIATKRGERLAETWWSRDLRDFVARKARQGKARWLGSDVYSVKVGKRRLVVKHADPAQSHVNRRVEEEAQLARAIRRKGLRTPSYPLVAPRQDTLVMGHVRNATPLHRVFLEWSKQLSRKKTPAGKRKVHREMERVLLAVARDIRRGHDKGIYFGDLSTHNILLRPAKRRPQLFFLDFGFGTEVHKGPLKRAERLADLQRFFELANPVQQIMGRALPRTALLRFMKAYDQANYRGLYKSLAEAIQAKEIAARSDPDRPNL